ncbi:MAG TPA: TetR family transcriptional regulator [Pseudonocardiaceae bacterium]|nr:TetR family transcriptional regulator [Pseudonocardiaceae bacterium]
MVFTERSRAAREAILAAARRRFTEEGYERTTIRTVAADAGLDPSMVMRYYGSKDGLFSAAIDVDLHLPDLTGVPPSELGATIARHFVVVWESDWGRENLLILLRSAASAHAGAAERVRSVFTSQIVPMVRAATGDAPDAEARAGQLSTYLLGTVLCRYIVRLPPVVAMDADTLAATMAPVLRRILTGSRADGS